MLLIRKPDLLWSGFLFPAALPGFGREFVPGGRFLWVMLAILKYYFKFAM